MGRTGQPTGRLGHRVACTMDGWFKSISIAISRVSVYVSIMHVFDLAVSACLSAFVYIFLSSSLCIPMFVSLLSISALSIFSSLVFFFVIDLVVSNSHLQMEEIFMVVSYFFFSCVFPFFICVIVCVFCHDNCQRLRQKEYCLWFVYDCEIVPVTGILPIVSLMYPVFCRS